MKPVIGITCDMSYHTTKSNFVHLPNPFHQLSDAYVQAIEAVGGIPLILPSYQKAELMLGLIPKLDGILFSGGGDADPLIFGERAVPAVSPIQPRRDAVELLLAKYVLTETDLPVLGICRGMQVVNLSMGGTVYVDLASKGKLEHRMSMYPRQMASHKVALEPQSRLAQIIGGAAIGVNSYHHQAVKELASDFIAAAYSEPDRVIEAMEKPGDRFVVMVQWHPEGMTDDSSQQAIFKSFIGEAEKYRLAQRSN